MTIIFRNTFTKETFEMGVEVLPTETKLEAAWTRGVHAVAKLTGWRLVEIQPINCGC
jgi:hypothetical protein